MATTWTLLKATPHSACYELAGGGGPDAPGVLDYSDAPTFAALVPGPYKNFIRKNLGFLDALNLSDAGDTGPRKRRIRMYQVSGAPLSEVNLDFSYTLTWNANGLTATLSSGEGEAVRRIEIRFIHSSRR